jgi:hypothetical protein
VSFDPFGHSPDLAALANEGFELEVTAGGHLLVKNVPYRSASGSVEKGTLVSSLVLDGDVTVNPVDDHSAWFAGRNPCNGLGQPLRPIIESRDFEIEAGIPVNHRISHKKDDQTKYKDYFEKVVAYADLIERPAVAIESTASARTCGPCLVDSSDWPFEYVDTASGRAGIGALSGILTGQKIGIVGLGGTGSYILDLVSKCPVDEIHLYDGDRFSTHNAFRAPGAASLEQLRASPPKVQYLTDIYTRMKRRVISHPYAITAANASELTQMSFVFLAMEGGDTKRQIVDVLDATDVAFVDASLGVQRYKQDGSLLASLEINGSAVANRKILHDHVDFGSLAEDDPYSENIQIAELNALNAALAVIWWKKRVGIYREHREHYHQRLHVGYNRLHVE